MKKFKVFFTLILSILLIFIMTSCKEKNINIIEKNEDNMLIENETSSISLKDWNFSNMMSYNRLISISGYDFSTMTVTKRIHHEDGRSLCKDLDLSKKDFLVQYEASLNKIYKTYPYVKIDNNLINYTSDHVNQKHLQIIEVVEGNGIIIIKIDNGGEEEWYIPENMVNIDWSEDKQEVERGIVGASFYYKYEFQILN